MAARRGDDRDQVPAHVAADVAVSDLRFIGSGGSANTYSGVDPERGPVAVKVIRLTDRDAAGRFQREVRSIERLRDIGGVVPILGSGATTQNEPYLIMPLMSGSLQERIDDQGSVGWEAAIDLVADVADIVHRAHSRSVIHADLKPANILLDATGRPYVADFGTSRILESTLTVSSRLMMTPSFAAPELFDGAKPTVLTDVYALGATLVALLTGRPPFSTGESDTPFAVMRRIMTDEPPDLVPIGVPVAVDQVVQAALAKPSDRRPPSAAELASALRTTAVDADHSGDGNVAAPHRRPTAPRPPSFLVSSGRLDEEPEAAEIPDDEVTVVRARTDDRTGDRDGVEGRRDDSSDRPSGAARRWYQWLLRRR